ncbi:T9SS type A sorting domain-containing protein [bacterium]|nr:T9SS type A sorting domain-containing protein [bacterium]
MSYSSSRCDPPDDYPRVMQDELGEDVPESLQRDQDRPHRAATLSLRLFNVIGQQVATLADGPYPPGQQRFTLDAHPLPTGLYFLHATVPGQLYAVEKVVLMK